jgi:small subunit ribosomal protein S20
MENPYSSRLFGIRNRSTILANSAQARKRARQAENRRQRNAGQRSALRTHIKNVVKAVATGDAEAAQSAYRKAVPVIDKSVGKGLIHKNKAARHKSRLGQHVRALQS